MASHRQKAMNATGGGQGQSVNLYFPADAKEEDISRLHHLAYEDDNIEGLYYVRSLNNTAKHQVDTTECLSCQG